VSHDAVCEAVECDEEGNDTDHTARNDTGDCLGNGVLLRSVYMMTQIVRRCVRAGEHVFGLLSCVVLVILLC